MKDECINEKICLARTFIILRQNTLVRRVNTIYQTGMKMIDTILGFMASS